MIRAYLHLRRFNIAPYKALKLSAPSLTIFEWIIVPLVMLFAGYGAIVNDIAAKNARDIELKLGKYEARMLAAEKSELLAKMELVVIGCLNREPIHIDGRSMDCQIKNHREAVDI